MPPTETARARILDHFDKELHHDRLKEQAEHRIRPRTLGRRLVLQQVVTRPLSGEPPTIVLAIGYSSANASPLLRRFLARTEELIENVSRQQKVRG